MIEIRAVKLIEEIEQLTQLFALVFKVKDSAESWKWKCIQHPLSSYIPEMIVAMDGGKIVGARPFMPNEFWLGYKKVIAAQHCYSMVHPAYRRQGIFNRMGRKSIDYLAEHDIVLSYGFPGPMSRKGFLSQGYRKLMDTEILFRFVNPLKKITSKPGNRYCDTNIGDFQIEFSGKYNAELSALDSFRNPNIIDLVRSEANLRWRFDECPHKNYSYILAKKEGSLKGYAVLSKQRQHSGLMAGIIVDYLVADNNAACFESLVTGAMQEFTRLGCHMAAVWAFSDMELRRILMQEFGFRSSLKLPYNRFISPIYMDVLLIDKSISAPINIYDSTNWRVTYAYPNFV